MAVVSVVCGALGWVGVPLIASVIAIVAGHLARSQIRQSGEEGDVLAILGLVLGYAHVLAICVGTIVVVLIYGGLIAFLAAMGIASS